MIRMIQSRSPAQAKEYFNDALTKSDYYLDSQELIGFGFHGKLAKRIGIDNQATKDVFYTLCENIHPLTGMPLTPRKKANRTTGYDINFHVPKSVSLINFLTGNSILEAFQQSVLNTMQHIEADAKTRVRKKGMDEDRLTGELLWADFTHFTARPVKGFAPDMHLHCHAYVFNATWDDTEKQIKAGQFRDIKSDMPYYQALFYKDLSDRLIGLGYSIKQTGKSFEIDGVPQAAIDLFSKRTEEINRIAKSDNITNEDALSELGSRTRARKQKGVKLSVLEQEWRKQINELGLDDATLAASVRRSGKQNNSYTAEQCISHALRHCFERVSVEQERRVLETALTASIGNNSASIQAIMNGFASDTRIIRKQQNGKAYCSTNEVLAEEAHMINLVTSGIGRLAPLYQTMPVLDLSGEHAKAARLALTTDDPVVIIEGRAGTGKTTMMKGTVGLIEKANKKVMVVAPTSQAARDVLRKEGFPDAETVAALLTNKELQASLKGQVLWVDEAGLLGTKDMTALLEIAAKNGMRVILSGDTKQHSSVPRGDAMRILRDVGKVKSVEITTIYRQKNEQYKQAVYDLSNGKIKKGFERLASLQAIVEVDPSDPYRQLVPDYLDSLKRNKTVLIISPKHKQGVEITKTVRLALRKQGKLDAEETNVTRLVNLNLTEAEKTNTAHYKPGLVLQFNKGQPGIQRGSRWVLDDIRDNKILIKNNMGQPASLALDHAASFFDIFEAQDMGLSKGDFVRITRNNYDTDKKRLTNGLSLQVASIGKKYLTLINKETKVQYKIPKDFGHLTHNYCVTSHASQGKTVDEVFIAHPSDSFSATDTKQFYVSVSRARERVRIYTDDKQSLQEHAARANHRLSALELLMQENAAEIVMREKTIEPTKEGRKDLASIYRNELKLMVIPNPM